jgi:hypothetical protein
MLSSFYLYPKEVGMETKIPEWFLSFYESIFSAQLRTIRQLKAPRRIVSKPRRGKGMSKMDMALDILRQAKRPLHVSELLAQIKAKHGVALDRESLVSALVKKVHRNQGVTRPAPNTFEMT